MKAALDNADAIVLDENGEPLIFERKDAPKEIEQLRPFGEVARMKLDAIDHFYPHTKIIKEEDVCRYRELEEGEDNADH